MRRLLIYFLSVAQLVTANISSAISIQAARREGNTWKMEWSNPSNHEVTVERRDSLQSGTWQEIGSNVTNALGTFTDFSPPATNGFYRLSVKPLSVSMKPFNLAFVGTETYQFLRIRNQTTNSARIDLIHDSTWWAGGVWWYEHYYDPQIEAGATVYIPLRFWPGEQRSYSGTGIVRIAWPDGNSNIEFAISGTAISNSLDNMALVKGGTLPLNSPLAGQTVGDFLINRFEITKGEWEIIREWANNNGYDIPEADYQPVGYNAKNAFSSAPYSSDIAMKWCNAASERAGFTPVYRVNNQIYRTGNYNTSSGSSIRRDISANGFRLPTTAEWEWAARGGINSLGYIYSGDNTLTNVASIGSSVGVVGTRSPNELGIYDMSGNLWEWCSAAIDAHNLIRGGSWASSGSYAYECSLSQLPITSLSTYNFSFFLSDRAGFRPARNSQ